jgi:hypothetical protein
MQRAWIAGLVCAASLSLGAQDRLRTLPGYEQYRRMAPLLANGWSSGAVTPRWAPDSGSFTYNLRGRTYRFEIATMTSTSTEAGSNAWRPRAMAEVGQPAMGVFGMSSCACASATVIAICGPEAASPAAAPDGRASEPASVDVDVIVAISNRYVRPRRLYVKLLLSGAQRGVTAPEDHPLASRGAMRRYCS